MKFLKLNDLTRYLIKGKSKEAVQCLIHISKRESLPDILNAMDKALSHLSNQWYSQYDWDGKPIVNNPTVSYRDLDAFWEAYYACYQYIVKQFFEHSYFKKSSILIGTGTLGNIHKAILQIDLHLKFHGFQTKLLGFGLTPDSLEKYKKDIHCYVLSVMAHNKTIPALNYLFDLKTRISVPIFVGGSAFTAIDAWLTKKTHYMPYFLKKHPEARRFNNVSELITSVFGKQFVYTPNLDLLLINLNKYHTHLRQSSSNGYT